MANSEKPKFVLDCCNSDRSKMRAYESKNDLFLAGYFALKKKRNHKEKDVKNKEMRSKHKEGVSAYLDNPKTIQQSYSSGSLPKSLREHSFQPLSAGEFKSLIQQYRQL